MYVFTSFSQHRNLADKNLALYLHSGLFASTLGQTLAERV
jgi:hypothetical protein